MMLNLAAAMRSARESVDKEERSASFESGGAKVCGAEDLRWARMVEVGIESVAEDCVGRVDRAINMELLNAGTDFEV